MSKFICLFFLKRSRYNSMLENILNWLPENNRIERIWLMAKFDFVTRYYGSFLGLFWALLKPLFQLLIYYFVFTVIFNNSTEHFLMFLFVGIILFQFFTEAAGGSLRIFKSKRYLLENIQINRLDIFYAAICATFIGFLFNFTAFSVGNLFLNDSFYWAYFDCYTGVIRILFDIFGLGSFDCSFSCKINVSLLSRF